MRYFRLSIWDLPPLLLDTWDKFFLDPTTSPNNLHRKHAYKINILVFDIRRGKWDTSGPQLAAVR